MEKRQGMLAVMHLCNVIYYVKMPERDPISGITCNNWRLLDPAVPQRSPDMAYSASLSHVTDSPCMKQPGSEGV